MRALDLAEAERFVEIDVDEGHRVPLLSTLVSVGALLTGHFALHRSRHATMAFRFRGLGKDPGALKQVVDALFERMPDALGAALASGKVLSPETSGFFLGSAIARQCNVPIAISQTDLRRLPTSTLLSGSIEPNDKVTLVSDVSGTGASIDALCDLVAQRGAKLSGIVLFGVTDEDAFRRYCDRLHVPYRWLVSAKWDSYVSGSGCPGCMSKEPLLPIIELV